MDHVLVSTLATVNYSYDPVITVRVVTIFCIRIPFCYIPLAHARVINCAGRAAPGTCAAGGRGPGEGKRPF